MNVNVGGKLLQGRIGKIRDVAEIVSHSSISWDSMISSWKKPKGVVWRSPIYKSSIHSVFPGLFTDKINFLQVKMYSRLFSD